MRVALFLGAAPLALLASTAAVAAQPLFVNGSLVVATSTGGTVGDNAASPLTLVQYANVGGVYKTVGNAITLTQTANGTNLPFSSEYGSSSEGLLQRSADGNSLTIMGYGINAATFNASPTTYVPQTSTNAGKLTALAQSTSVPGTTAGGVTYTAVPRVVANITDYGVNTSTALYNVFDQNNPRSAYTVNGTSFYISGQGVSGDTTGGVFYAKLGEQDGTPQRITGLDTSKNTAGQDTRDVQGYNGQLYISVDSKSGSGNNRDFVGTLGTGYPTDVVNGGTGPAMLPGFGSSDGKGTLAMTAAIGNGLNTGQTINLSPEQYFFANADTLYVTDTGAPKNTSGNTSTIGDGGLQKWTMDPTTGVWTLDYTLAAGLNLVANNDTKSKDLHGVTGLFGLAGEVSGDSVTLFATSYTIGDQDTSYIYTITDSLSATTNSGTKFSIVDTAAANTKFMGLAFAPNATAAVPEMSTYAMMIGAFGMIGGAIRRRNGVRAIA